MDGRGIFVVGCSDGIGLELVRQLLDQGARVTGISRSASPLVHERYRHEILDVADATLGACLGQLLREEGTPRALYYCAAISERPSVAELARDLRVFDVNLRAAIETASIVLPAMQSTGGGRFIVVSSQADGIINPDASSYTASKAALTAYFEGLGLRLRRTSLRVSVVRFGFVATKLARFGWQPFRLTREQAAGRLVRLLEGRAPLRVTYPLRAAGLVAIAAWVMRLRVRLG